MRLVQAILAVVTLVGCDGRDAPLSAPATAVVEDAEGPPDSCPRGPSHPPPDQPDDSLDTPARRTPPSPPHPLPAAPGLGYAAA